ncbi:MAG: patatin-like phospholipase family protein [Solirubrobacteraceae bacterium]
MIDDLNQSGPDEGFGERIGLVLSGGGARGAYEVGVLSVLLPALEARGDRPSIIVGTSVGALNAAYLAASAEQGWVSAIEAGCRVWQEIDYGEVLGPLLSLQELGRGLGFGLELLGLPVRGPMSVLDNAPLAVTIKDLISFDRLAKNVQNGVIDTAALVATSYDTGRSVVFYDTAATREPPQDDPVRGIDYAPTRLKAAHVRASSAIEALFPAVEVSEPPSADGWYGDGGTSLNTPLKPALAFGAERLIVIGLNSIGGSPRAVATRPADAFDGAAQALQALLTDQLANDVATLATINQLLAANEPEAHDDESGPDRRVIPYIFVAPRERFAVGRLASEICGERYGGIRGLARGLNLALLGRVLDATRNHARGELFSYVFFAPEFTSQLIEQGRRDAESWLEREHDDGPWRIGDPPLVSDPARAAPRGRRHTATATASGR